MKIPAGRAGYSLTESDPSPFPAEPESSARSSPSPVQALDILIIDEIGKNFSGAGMDTKLVNRGVNGEYNPWDTAPRFDRIFLRGLGEHSSARTDGNGRTRGYVAVGERRR